MTFVISVLGQKGGVGKSTISRLIATEFARQVTDGENWNVKIADLDVSQKTCVNWVSRRMANNIVPEVRAEPYRVDKALKEAARGDLDVMVLDGQGEATMDTLTAARGSDVIIIPTGTSSDDWGTQIPLAHELRLNGVDMNKVLFVLTRTGKSDKEDRDARRMINQAGYTVVTTTLAEQAAYRQATDTGHAVSETGFKNLNEKAQNLFVELIAPLNNQTETQDNAA
ncbi:ParA family protein [Methylorubrum sp. SB2]|uniref:ParA family protein n=1 Tax=Methylorubrum subtropicum TaxID=3138812 RepID=UPI00313F3BAB